MCVINSLDGIITCRWLCILTRMHLLTSQLYLSITASSGANTLNRYAPSAPLLVWRVSQPWPLYHPKPLDAVSIAGYFHVASHLISLHRIWLLCICTPTAEAVHFCMNSMTDRGWQQGARAAVDSKGGILAQAAIWISDKTICTSM